MSSNPYAPPLAVVDEAPARDGTPPVFFAVGTAKLLTMTAATLGLYQVFWFYQQWRLVRARDGSAILPVPRAIFGLFFCHKLFARIAADGRAQGLSDPPASWLATAWVVGCIVWRLPGPAAFLGMLSWLTLLPMQDYANRLNAKVAPGHDRNTRLSWINWIVVLVAAGFYGLVLIGLLAPAP